MKNVIGLFFTISLSISMYGQNTDKIETKGVTVPLETDSIFLKVETNQDTILELKLLCEKFQIEYDSLYFKVFKDTTILGVRTKVVRDLKKSYIGNLGEKLMKILFKIESYTFYNLNISSETRRLIVNIHEPYMLVLLEKAIDENNLKEKESSIFFTTKILNEISDQISLLMTNTLPGYRYPTKNKRILKFISIKTGNDLFAFSRKNEDRDYTGSLLIEFGTDYLNPQRRRPLKSYQTFLVGFDVFTPQFNDTTKFKEFDDVDSLDRPHGSFEYIGWSKKGLSKFNNWRWSTTVKVGRIGGRIGETFQSILHQDVSFSLRPKGWDAQISNGGRLGVSLETEHEFQLTLNEEKNYMNSLKNFYLSPMIEFKLGTYMTNATLGIQIGNKSFEQNNQNQINHRVHQGVKGKLDHFSYNISFKSTYVVHNTMLEGYGIINTTDQTPSKADLLTPKSIYVLQADQIQRLVHTARVRLSYTANHITFFYNWYAFSPETKLGSLKTDNIYSSDVDLSNRWHNFAEVGISFNLK